MKIVITEPLKIDKTALTDLCRPFEDLGHTIEFYDDVPAHCEEKIKRIGDADAIIIANSPLEREVIEACPNLKFIDVAFTGVDHVALDAAKEKDIRISNAAGYSTQAVAELAIGLMIGCYRRLAEAHAFTKEEKAFPYGIGRELGSKTVGVIGTGAIGQRVAKLLLAFGCKVLAFSRTEKAEMVELGVSYATLESVLSQSDIVTLHLPLNEKTTHLMGEKALSLMKENAVLINTARGKIVDNHALARALNDGKLAGAGIDVFDMEPPLPVEEPVHNARNVLLAPHIAYSTQESMLLRAQIVFENLKAWLEDRQENIIL